MGETTRQAFSEELHRINIKIEKNEEYKMKATDNGRTDNKRSDHIHDDSTNDSVEEVPSKFNEIIVLDDTEKPPELADNRTTGADASVSEFNSPKNAVAGVGCKDCEDV